MKVRPPLMLADRAWQTGAESPEEAARTMEWSNAEMKEELYKPDHSQDMFSFKTQFLILSFIIKLTEKCKTNNV